MLSSISIGSIEMMILLMAWALLVAVIDIRQRRIPNVLLLIALLPALAGLIWQGQGVLGAGPWQSLTGAGLALLLLMPGHLAGFLGAGDVKYGTCIGLLVGGWLPVLWTLLFSGLALGVMSIGFVVASRRRRRPVVRIPAAVALSIGLWTVCGIRLSAG